MRLGWTAGTERVWFFVGAGPRPARGRGNSPSPLSRYARHLPLIRGVVPSPTGFKKAFRGWVGEPLGAPVGGVRAKKSPSSVWPSGQPPSPWKGEGLSGRVWDPPLRRITKTVSRLRRGRSQTGPTVYAPGAFARQTQARKWNRTGGNFCKPRAQWPGRNRGKPLRFCAPEILQDLTGTRPP